MEQIPIRVLNQNTASVLERVEQGEAVEITNRGKPVARIVPVVEGELDDLVAAGLVIPPTITGRIPMPTFKAEPGVDAGEIVSSMRDEERW